METENQSSAKREQVKKKLTNFFSSNALIPAKNEQ